MNTRANNRWPATLTDRKDGPHPGAGQGSSSPSGLSPYLARAGPLAGPELASVLLADQSQRWRRGERVLAEEYLRQPGMEGNDAALDLIYNEVRLRRERGEAAPDQEYLERFPHHADALRRLFLVGHELLSSQLTPSAPPGPSNGAGSCPAMIGKYRVVARLGEGGQAEVYRAVHPTLDREVVVKLGHVAATAGPADRERFLAEGKMLAELEHPALATAYDLDFHEGRPFLVMEYVPGRNLSQYARQQPLSPRRAAGLLAPVARALALAHRRGLVHRDVKPSNILVGADGRPRLIDFGLALLRDAWHENHCEPEVSGTPAYMAPEQARGETDRVGPRSDVFGLGAVLYFLLTGEPPFGQGSLTEVLARAGRGAWDRGNPRFLKAPRWLRAVCRRALALEPEARYARAEDLAADLEAFARPRWPWLALGAGVALALLALALLAAPLLRRGPAPPPSGQPAPVIAPPTAEQPSLTVRVWRKGRYRPVTAAAPLHTGDELEARGEVPAGTHASLFLWGSDGKVELLARWPAAPRPRQVRYPEDEGRSVPLTGAPGTEVLVLCASRSGPVELEDFRALVGAGGPLPALPGLTVLGLERDRLVVLQSGRGLGPPRARPSQEADVRRRLDGLRQRLGERFEYLAGTAFAHQAPDGQGE